MNSGPVGVGGVAKEGNNIKPFISQHPLSRNSDNEDKNSSTTKGGEDSSAKPPSGRKW